MLYATLRHTRWVFGIQPSEVMKYITIIYIAHILHQFNNKEISVADTILRILIPVGVVVLVIFPENLSMALLICFNTLLLLFVGRVITSYSIHYTKLYEFFLDNYKGKEQRFLDYLEDMHLMSPLGLDIIGERKPYFPSMDDKRMWSGISVPWMAVGYGQQISPMQTLAFYNAIANDGIMVKPRFIKGYRRDKSLDMLRKRPYVLNSSVCSRATLKTVRGLLEGVVERGT